MPKENTVLTGKTVLLGICACTPAYRAIDLLKLLKHSGAVSKTAVTENATNMVPLAILERVSGNPVSVQQFGNGYAWDPEKKSWAKSGDILVIAPCTADMIGKLANGIADDFISTNAMAFPGPKVISANMNPNFWKNPAVQRNIAQLKEDGYIFVKNDDPEKPSKMASPETILEVLKKVAEALPEDEE
ncbi:MAG: flavoprotein [Clostridia bacterium]|nr:flavoprotein [Clostridia bacterium]